MLMPRLKRLDRKGWGRRKKLELPEMPEPPSGALDLEDELVKEIMGRISGGSSDYKMAKRVAHMKRTMYPDGTIPELITADFLDQREIPYTFQAWIYGGRSRQGGVVPDFVLEYLGKGMAWLIQGEYWHSKADVSASDEIDKVRLVGTWFHNVYIEAVIEIWEDAIYHKRPEVFDMALMGIEIGR